MNVVLIDGKNTLYRYGWTFQNLIDGEGRKTGAVYGLLNALLSMKRHYGLPIVVWDGRHQDKSWRKQLYPDYKAQRAKGSSLALEVFKQKDLVCPILEILNVPCIEVESVEADDIIGIASSHLIGKGYQPYVLSNDHDFFQLMPGVKIIQKDTVVKQRWVEEKYGCSIEHVIKLKAFAGDKSDNIQPAIRGVGLKKGATLLAQYGMEYALPALRFNIRLMTILRSVKSDELNLEQKRSIRDYIRRAVQMIRHPQEVNKSAMLEAFGSMQLNDAIRRRQEFLNLYR